MTDPQYPQAPVAAPSPTWNSRFDFYNTYGHPSASAHGAAAFKQLSFGERFRLTANGPAFFFGPIYFAIKGPWRKGLSLFGVAVAISALIGVIELAFDISFPAAGFGAAIGVLYSTAANWAYYQHVAYGSTSWNPFEGVPLLRARK
ncbi:hypothetical protein TPAU25S_02339 [Tsukamurella paurometabola]|uniref:DUF2628 domain-containing protein n=1 Tax=Tsukamurella paurometabola (strain ATCC 8368 / DSM 20162 / CCUG 35730 / CIP 100753 / JCM 10117 / KCTC 9821 / NBRC 16120 / NCIMB 702349 / NCTC 13040) TaxID=521096 RepID=D5USD1_TSUPD|nr:DUF2628 domain-containing protein [Tsukamurella paurometabola]ADG77198.1 conserved hypothetical protein [Tsukamurella paurometabola DSM 20162]SUP43128.1 Protein of uncharacterised function (DUF2628) [Tsukamurella paurometabola]